MKQLEVCNSENNDLQDKMDILSLSAFTHITCMLHFQLNTWITKWK